MRNLLYFLGITSFLAMMIFTVATSLTNPFYGMSKAALAQGTTTTTGGDCPSICSTNCTPSGSLPPLLEREERYNYNYCCTTLELKWIGTGPEYKIIETVYLNNWRTCDYQQGGVCYQCSL